MTGGMNMVDFGHRLKNLRIKNDYTQEKLAKRLGLTKSVISAYETGTRMPSYEALITIARIFHVTTDYLLGVENQNTLELSGLTQEQIDAIRSLVRTMKKG